MPWRILETQRATLPRYTRSALQCLLQHKHTRTLRVDSQVSLRVKKGTDLSFVFMRLCVCVYRPMFASLILSVVRDNHSRPEGKHC